MTIRITAAGFTRSLGAAVIYDVVLAPFVVPLVSGRASAGGAPPDEAQVRRVRPVSDRSRLRLVVLASSSSRCSRRSSAGSGTSRCSPAPRVPARRRRQPGPRHHHDGPPRRRSSTTPARPGRATAPPWSSRSTGSRCTRQPDDGAQVLHRLARLLGDAVHATSTTADPAVRHRRAEAGRMLERVAVRADPGHPAQGRPQSTRLALQILERKEDFPGVTAQPCRGAHYPKPSGAYATHVLGYLAPITQEELRSCRSRSRTPAGATSSAGTGLEQEYDKYLRGAAGVKQVAVDHVGGVTGVLRQTAPKPGDDLVTQPRRAGRRRRWSGRCRGRAARSQLGTGGTAARPTSRPVSCSTRKTGHVVAMGSYPSYNPSLWDAGRIETKV